METVGDKYMAVSGLPEECITHAKSVAKLALDLMDVSKELRDPNNHLIEVILYCRMEDLEMEIGYLRIHVE